MAADDDSAVWDLDCDDDDDSSTRRPIIEADRVRSAGSSAGRTSSGSRYSIDGFDFAFTRGVDYAEISEELAHMAVWSSLQEHPEAQGAVEEAPAAEAPAAEAAPVEAPPPAEEAPPPVAEKPAVVEAEAPAEAKEAPPVSEPPAEAVAAEASAEAELAEAAPLEAPPAEVTPAEAPPAELPPVEAPPAEASPAEAPPAVAAVEEQEALPSADAWDVELLEESLVEPVEIKVEETMLTMDSTEMPSLEPADLQTEISVEASTEAPLQLSSEKTQDAKGLEPAPDVSTESKLAGDLESEKELEEDNRGRVAPAESLEEEYGLGKTQQVLDSLMPGSKTSDNSTDEVSTDLKHAGLHEVTADPAEAATEKEAAVEPVAERQEDAQTRSAVIEPTTEKEAAVEPVVERQIDAQIRSEVIEPATEKEAAVEPVIERQEDAQIRSEVIEPSGEVSVSTDVVDRSVEPFEIKVEQSMLTMDSTEMPSLEPADLQTETSVEASAEAPLQSSSEKFQDAEVLEPAPDVSTESKLAGDLESEKELEDFQPSRVAPAESLKERYGRGKTEEVLDSMMPRDQTEEVLDSMMPGLETSDNTTDEVGKGLETSDNTTDELSILSMKYAGPHEMTADPAQAVTETELKPKEDPLVVRKNTLGREHEAWVASVFSKMAAEAPPDRPVRKPGMQRLSTISIARALGCYPAVQYDASSPSVAKDSHMAHAGTNSIRSPLSSAPMSSQPRSLWTPPSPPAPSSIRSQGSAELSKVPPLAGMPATGFRLSPTNSANSELASAARRCRSAVPGLDMTKVHMGYDDDEDTEDDHTSSLFKTQKGLTVEAGENTPTSGAKAEVVPQLNIAALQKKGSSGQSNKLTHESGGPRSSLTSPPAPRGIPSHSHGQELREEPPRPQAPTPRTAGQIDGRDSLRPHGPINGGDNMVVGRPLDYWRGGKPQRRATVDTVDQGPFPSLNVQKRHTASAGGIGMGSNNLEMMTGIYQRRAVSASELQRPVPLDQPILQGHAHKAFSSPSPAPPPGSAPAALPGSKSVPLLPNAVRDPASNSYSATQGNLFGADQWTLDAIGCVVADKKLPLNAPAVVRLPPVGEKQQWQKWQVGNRPGDGTGFKRSKATIISHTHVHHHHHYHVRRPTAAADTGPGVPGASAEGTQAS